MPTNGLLRVWVPCICFLLRFDNTVFLMFFWWFFLFLSRNNHTNPTVICWVFSFFKHLSPLRLTLDSGLEPVTPPNTVESFSKACTSVEGDCILSSWRYAIDQRLHQQRLKWQQEMWQTHEMCHDEIPTLASHQSLLRRLNPWPSSSWGKDQWIGCSPWIYPIWRFPKSWDKPPNHPNLGHFNIETIPIEL